MTAYVKMVSNFVRAHFGGNDAGQNMIETALLIGVISLVLVGAFMATDIKQGITNLAEQASCQIQGGAYDLPSPQDQTGTCDWP